MSICICGIGKRAIKDNQLNKDSITSNWFEFYSTEMDALVNLFDELMDRLTENCTSEEKKRLRRISYKVLFMKETFQYGLRR